MKITLDQSTDAAYIYFSSSMPNNAVANTYPCDPVEVGADINIDFDVFGRILGIEVLDASKHLPIELLKAAEIIG